MLTSRNLVVALMSLALMPVLLLSLGESAGADDWDGDPVIRPRGENEGKPQVDKSSNGKPAQGKVDSSAVARLEELSEILAKEEGREQDVIDGALPLVKTFEANDDMDHLVDCVFLLGEAYYHAADWANAEKYMARAADLGFRYFGEEMSTYPLKVIGDAQHEQGKDDAALSTYRDRAQRLRKNDPEFELAGALFDLGSMQINTGRFDEALATLSESQQSNQARIKALGEAGQGAPADEIDGAKVDQAEILFHLGIAAFRKGDMTAARGWLGQALSAFEQVSPASQEEFRDRRVALLDDLVQVSEQLGDMAAAEQYRQQRDALNS
ncbi:hypothetical protein IT575_04710 [bacterium]|nr:hypothetical protein [bacterium]